MSDKLERFTDLMRRIFELDKSDLDFGIYRIINIRKTEIEAFLEKTLPEKVRDILKPYAQGNAEELKGQIAEVERSAKEFGYGSIEDVPESVPMAQKYRQLKQQLAEGADLAELETDVYSALYTFFGRYYEEGDFISKRRYKEGVYAIPYEGEEVKLYWANQDQYYIKTSENFKDYTFVAEGYTIHFRLVDATTEQNNNKESAERRRVFMLYTETDEAPEVKTFTYDRQARELTVRFVFDVPQDTKRKYEEENDTAISGYVVKHCKELIPVLFQELSKDKKRPMTLLQKHLRAYAAKNTFDYFIHKDLRGFLNRELDFYIKSEIMHLDDLDTEHEVQAETYLATVRAIRGVGRIIIDFLAQIEDFQKKLWLKKKFVVETGWCITLDRIGAEYYPEIASNAAQKEEWVELYAIAEAEGWTDPPTPAFLRANSNLVLDTRHFSEDFKNRLLADIDDLDAQTNGVMINADNFQALRLLLRQYENSIRLIYIDPPYNTDASKILYKNGYEHSSWIALMHARLEAGRRVLSDRGVVEAAIDDYELRYLSACMDQVFGADNAVSNIAIMTNPKGRDQGFIAQAHDYTVIYAKNKRLAQTNNFVLSEEALAKKFSKQKDGEAMRELPLKRTGSGKWREERPYMYFPFFYSPKDDHLMVVPEAEYKKIYDAEKKSFDDAYVAGLIGRYAEKGYEAILPVSSKGELFRWRWGYASCVRGVKNGVLFCKKVRSGGYAVYQYDEADSEATPKSLWFGERYDASTKGTNLLQNILPNNPFDYPKSLYTVEDNIVIGSDGDDTVLDFFAGSATTGHAVIDLNRTEEDSNRKYILVEMGNYFDTVTKPRMQKVIYAADWKDGKPENRGTGISQIMKYMRLESYEDALSNIKLSDSTGHLHSLFGDDYLIHYMLELESKDSLLDLDGFNTPFDYKLKITEKNETGERGVDLRETFQYLIGMAVSRRSPVAYFRAAPAQKPGCEGCVDLVEDADGPYGFQHVEGTLPDGSRGLILWRTVTADIRASNAALDAYFLRRRVPARDRQLDVVFVNGDCGLENLRPEGEHWKVRMIEPEFKARMFEER